VQRDWPDLCGGLALAAVGAAAAVWSVLHYDLGSLRQMGPGAFPATLGGIVVVLGVIVALPALRRAAPAANPQIGSILGVLGAILIFGFGLSHLGLVLATAISVLVASLPAPPKGWRWRFVLSAAVAALTVFVFSIGLQMTVPLWPRLS
jgi:MFS family permease